MKNDNRIKAFMLRHGFAIPTDQQLWRFPIEIRTATIETREQRFAYGVALLAWLSKQNEVIQ